MSDSGINLATAYVNIVPSAKGIKGSIQKTLDPEAASAGKSAGEKSGVSLASAFKTALKFAALGTFVKKALDVGGDLQQSYLGGLDTLYGEAADGARKYAMEASKAGISANSYAEQAVSFGAALKNAYGGDTQKAMEAANTAIMDMADNAAKMGTPLESIQTAYQGFAKQNYTMLDNLKLGYGGTKKEMERLLADAQKISGVKYDISNLGDVYDAIHVIQGELGLTGVAAEEAKTTLTGSFGAMKAAFENFMGSLALGQNVEPSLKQLIESAKTFLMGNLIPMIGNVLSNSVVAISTATPMILDAVDDMICEIFDALDGGAISDGLDMLMSHIGSTLTSLVEKLPRILNLVSNLVMQLVGDIIEKFPNILNGVARLLQDIITELGRQLPNIIENVIINLSKMIEAIIGSIPDFLLAALNIGQAIINGLMSIDWLGMGARLVKLIATGVSSLGFSFGPIDSIIGSVNETFNIIITALPQFLQNIFDMILDAINNIVEALPSIITGITTILSNVVNTIASHLPDILNAVLNIITSTLSTIISNLPQFLAAAVKLIATVIQGLLSSIPQLLSTVLNMGNKMIQALFSIDWLGLGKKLVQMIINGIQSLIGKIPEIFQSAWNTVVSGAQAAWNAICSVFSNLASFFGNIFTEAWSRVKAVFSTGGQIFAGITEGILSAFKAIVNAIIGGINKVVAIPFNGINAALDGLRNIGIGDLKPFTWLPSISVPQIPYLARGGILQKGQTGFLEGTGAEAVVPLDQNKYWVNAVARELDSSLMRLSENLGPETSVRGINQTINIFQPVKSPAETARAIKTTMKYGLAGGHL